MFEKRNQPVLPFPQFMVRFARSLVIGMFFIFVALSIGMLGYHHYEHMTWVDAFANASMILSGMGPLTPLVTSGGKLFAGFYALFSGLFFILVMGLIFAPVIHRFFHKLHVDSKNS